jgi:hypothetical protein
LGLLYKDETTTTAQTATVLAGGALVLIGFETAATSQAFSATGGTFGTPVGGGGAQAATTVEYGAGNTSVMLSSTNATAVAVRWAAPSTVGTYTISSYASTATTNFITLATKGDGTNRGNITVTVTAAAVADGSSTNTSCVTDASSGAQTTTADSTATVSTGSPWYIKYALINAYGSDVSTSGNLVATVTGDAVVSIGSGTQSAGTGTTVVAYGTGAAGSTYDALRVDQATAGAPVTTTVTLTYNGAVVCTKTVTIRGAAASMKIGSIATGDLGSSTGSAAWIADGTNRIGHYTVTLLDSAGNIALPSASTEFAAVSSSLTTTITALAIGGGIATDTSSTKAASYSVGTFTCGPVAGSSTVKLSHTNAATGKIITGDLTARCADIAYTYTASFDKASYVQGEVATLTVQFLDSKGNPANRKATIAALAAADVHIVAPMLTPVTSVTGAAALYTVRPDINGKKTYTFSVGTASGLTAGKYNAVVDYYAMVAAGATKPTVQYSVTSGGDTTTNADVLKSIVALIASINKQIQALQKLILARR